MKKKLAIYFFLAYIITWLFCVLIILQIIPKEMHFLGAFGPAFAAIIITFVDGSIRQLFLNTVNYPKKRTLLLLTFSPIIFGLIGYMALIIFQQDVLIKYENFVLTILPIFTYGIFEELGWRGYALQKLQQFFHPFVATCILTIFWAAWHIPMFFYRFHFTSLFMIVGFVFTMFCGAIILTALYNASQKSILAVMIFHMTNNLVSIITNDIYLSVYSMLLIILTLIISIVSKWNLFYNTTSIDKNGKIM